MRDAAASVRVSQIASDRGSRAAIAAAIAEPPPPAPTTRQSLPAKSKPCRPAPAGEALAVEHVAIERAVGAASDGIARARDLDLDWPEPSGPSRWLSRYAGGRSPGAASTVSRAGTPNLSASAVGGYARQGVRPGLPFREIAARPRRAGGQRSGLLNPLGTRPRWPARNFACGCTGAASRERSRRQRRNERVVVIPILQQPRLIDRRSLSKSAGGLTLAGQMAGRTIFDPPDPINAQGAVCVATASPTIQTARRVYFATIESNRRGDRAVRGGCVSALRPQPSYPCAES
jgi:hypothetical protein